MTHTPGPWRVYEEQVLDFPRRMSIQTTSERGTETLADLRLKSISDLPIEANAALIAAAPALLAALEASLYAMEHGLNISTDFPEHRRNERALSAARDAIALARGE